MPKRFWVLAVLCSILPDFDAIGFKLGVPYESFWGHRGFTHSLVFALLVALVVLLLFFREYARDVSMWWQLVLFFFLITTSHAILDMLTSGGHGVAIFAPFDNTRYFFPWRPIVVSPIGIEEFFSEWGIRVMLSEVLWVWLPLSMVVGGVYFIRRRAREGAKVG